MSGSDDEEEQRHHHAGHAADAEDKPDEEAADHSPSVPYPAASTLRRDLQRDAGASAARSDAAPAATAVKASPWYVDYLPYIIAICIALLLIYWFFNRAPAAEHSSASK